MSSCSSPAVRRRAPFAVLALALAGHAFAQSPTPPTFTLTNVPSDASVFEPAHLDASALAAFVAREGNDNAIDRFDLIASSAYNAVLRNAVVAHTANTSAQQVRSMSITADGCRVFYQGEVAAAQNEFAFRDACGVMPQQVFQHFRPSGAGSFINHVQVTRDGRYAFIHDQAEGQGLYRKDLQAPTAPEVVIVSGSPSDGGGPIFNDTTLPAPDRVASDSGRHVVYVHGSTPMVATIDQGVVTPRPLATMTNQRGEAATAVEVAISGDGTRAFFLTRGRPAWPNEAPVPANPCAGVDIGPDYDYAYVVDLADGIPSNCRFAGSAPHRGDLYGLAISRDGSHAFWTANTSFDPDRAAVTDRWDLFGVDLNVAPSTPRPKRLTTVNAGDIALGRPSADGLRLVVTTLTSTDQRIELLNWSSSSVAATSIPTTSAEDVGNPYDIASFSVVYDSAALHNRGRAVVRDLIGDTTRGNYLVWHGVGNVGQRPNVLENWTVQQFLAGQNSKKTLNGPLLGGVQTNGYTHAVVGVLGPGSQLDPRQAWALIP